MYKNKNKGQGAELFMTSGIHVFSLREFFLDIFILHFIFNRRRKISSFPWKGRHFTGTFHLKKVMPKNPNSKRFTVNLIHLVSRKNCWLFLTAKKGTLGLGLPSRLVIITLIKKPRIFWHAYWKEKQGLKPKGIGEIFLGLGAVPAI